MGCFQSSNTPNWTEVLQALSALAGLIFLAINIWYLHQADKKQTEQIRLLIATNRDSTSPRFVLSQIIRIPNNSGQIVAMIVFLKNEGGTAFNVEVSEVNPRLIIKEKKF